MNGNKFCQFQLAFLFKLYFKQCVKSCNIVYKSFLACLSGEPDGQLNPKKKIWETVKPDLRVDNSMQAAYKGAVLCIEGKGKVTAPTLSDAQIS